MLLLNFSLHKTPQSSPCPHTLQALRQTLRAQQHFPFAMPGSPRNHDADRVARGEAIIEHEDGADELLMPFLTFER